MGDKRWNRLERGREGGQGSALTRRGTCDLQEDEGEL